MGDFDGADDNKEEVFDLVFVGEVGTDYFVEGGVFEYCEYLEDYGGGEGCTFDFDVAAVDEID